MSRHLEKHSRARVQGTGSPILRIFFVNRLFPGLRAWGRRRCKRSGAARVLEERSSSLRAPPSLVLFLVTATAIGVTACSLSRPLALRGAPPPGRPLPGKRVPPSVPTRSRGELGTLTRCYKPSAGGASQLASWPLRDEGRALAATSCHLPVRGRLCLWSRAPGLAQPGQRDGGDALGAAALDDGDPHKQEFLALAAKAASLASKD